MTSLDRRKVLKATGTALAGGVIGTGAAGTVSARRLGRTKYDGILYDSVSGAYLGDASAALTRRRDGTLRGRISLPDLDSSSIPRETLKLGVPGPSRVTAKSERYHAVKRGPWESNGSATNVNLLRTDTNVTGVIKPATNHAERAVGFYLEPGENAASRERMATEASRNG